MNILTEGLAADLKTRLSDEKIDAAFALLPPARRRETADIPAEAVRVAALQVQLVPYGSLALYLRDMDRYIGGAARRGARLVCLPELAGLLPALLSPAAHLALAAIGLGSRAASPSANAAPAPALPGAAGLLAPFAFLEPCYRGIMARFARRHGVYLSCGSCLVPEGGRVYNRHVLLSPAGETLAVQDKMHLVEEEAGFGLSAGNSLSVAQTPIGNIALTVCMDASYFETFKIAKAQGADYALVPIANLEPYNHYLALRGAQMRVSETCLPAVKAALVAKQDFPLGFTGRAGVYFPVESGLPCKEMPSHTRPGMVLANIDLPALRAARPRLFGRPNPAFNRQYVQTLQSAPSRTACRENENTEKSKRSMT